MFKKLLNLKKFIWIAASAVCLLALFIGFLFAAIAPYGANKPKSKPTVTLGSAAVSEKKDKKADKQTDDAASEEYSGEVITGETVQVNAGSVKLLEETADAGQEYIDSLTFLCDSCMIGLRDYGLLTGGSANKQVLGTSSGSLMVNSLSTALVVNPSDKSELSVSQAMMVLKPEILVIMVGSDGLSSADETQFKTSYKAMLSTVQAASKDTKIVCCSVLPVIADYSGIDGLNVTITSEACEWIKDICGELGLYYCDTRQAVKNDSGILSNQFAGSNGKTMNTQGIEQILQYLRTHALT